METKSTVYNIYGNYLGALKESEDIEDIDEIDCEYNALLENVKASAHCNYGLSTSFDIRVDQGCYHFLPNGAIELSKIPEFHVVVSGSEFFEMTETIKNLVESNEYLTCLEYFEIPHNALNDENQRKLNEHSYIRNEYSLICQDRTKSISEYSHQRIINISV